LFANIRISREQNNKFICFLPSESILDEGEVKYTENIRQNKIAKIGL